MPPSDLPPSDLPRTDLPRTDLHGVRQAAQRNADLLAAAALAVVAALLALVAGIPTPVRILVAIPVVFAAPGYTVTEALLPGRNRGPVERVLLAVTLSISVSVLGGLLLNLLPAGLTRTTQTLLLSVVTLAGAATAALRRARVKSAGPAEPGEPSEPAEAAEPRPVRRALRLSPAGIASLVLAIAVASAAIAIGVQTAQAHDTASFTQLWITANSSSTRAQVGVMNDEGAAQSYTLDLTTHGGSGRTYGFRLQDTASWRTEIALPATAKGYPVTVRLYRTQAPGVLYREVSLGASPS